ncbi:MAG TPA: hypothetical protein VMW66_02960 [Elusimicrobiales bacterium]|nr:hypothetical protein [Elusimicrobiales bacterium]
MPKKTIINLPLKEEIEESIQAFLFIHRATEDIRIMKTTIHEIFNAVYNESKKENKLDIRKAGTLSRLADTYLSLDSAYNKKVNGK